MSPERSYSPRDPEFAFIGMAHMLTGIDYPNNPQGLSAATNALRVQHDKIMPPAPSRSRLQQVVAQRDPLITITEQMAAIALNSNDYETVLTTANHLHAFAEIEQARKNGNAPRELELLRGVIHMVTLNGTLGKEAKQRFDPFALVQIERS